MEHGYMLKTHKMSLKLLTARKTFNKIALPDVQSWEKTATVPPGSQSAIFEFDFLLILKYPRISGYS